jgi:hypothetical protein
VLFLLAMDRGCVRGAADSPDTVKNEEVPVSCLQIEGGKHGRSQWAGVSVSDRCLSSMHEALSSSPGTAQTKTC